MTFHLTHTPELSYEGSFISNDGTVTLPAIGGAVEASERSPLLPPVVQLLQHDEETGSASSNLPRPCIDSKRPPSKKRSRWIKYRQRAQYYVPALQWIPEYRLNLFWGDFAAGVTVASVIIPQSMSYAASLAHLDPSTGLFSSAIPGIAYAIFGTCKQLNVGPEAALSLLIGQTISALVPLDPHSEQGKIAAEGVATIIGFQVGLISLALGLMRLGFLDVVLSRSLLRGFITAIAFIIMVEQLIPMLGLENFIHSVDPTPVSVPEKILFLLEYAVSHGKKLTTLISFGSLVSLITLRSLKRKVARLGGKWAVAIYLPEVFVVVVLATIFSDVYDWHKKGVATLGLVKLDVGEIVDLPINRNTLPYLQKTTSTAFLICIAGFLDSISAAKQNSSRFHYSISPNRELVGLGAGNLVASFVPGTLPAYGSITRSKMNGDAGGRTQMASLVCSALVILSVFFLLPALRYLPKCVLAAVIGMVVNSIISESPHEILYYWKMSAWTDLFMMLLTFVFTIIWNVEVGIIVSVSVSLILIVKRSSKPHISILGRVPGTDTWNPLPHADESDDEGGVEVVPDSDLDGQEETPGVLIVRVRDDLDFANTGHLKERLRRLELYGPLRAHPSAPARRQQAMRAVVFHMADVEEIDASAAAILHEVCVTYKIRDVEVHFAHLRVRNLELFRKAGIVPDVVPLAHIHQNVVNAMRAIEYDSRGSN